MLLSGHGKPCGSAARLSEVRGAAAVRGSTVAPRSASGGSGPAGRGAPAVGQSLGRTTEAGRGTRLETSRTRRTQSAITPGGFTTHRAWVETRPGGAGLRNQLVDFGARGPSDRAGMRCEVPSLAGLADSAATGMELPASGRARAGTRRRQDSSLETAALAGD